MTNQKSDACSSHQPANSKTVAAYMAWKIDTHLARLICSFLECPAIHWKRSHVIHPSGFKPTSYKPLGLLSCTILRSKGIQNTSPWCGAAGFMIQVSDLFDTIRIASAGCNTAHADSGQSQHDIKLTCLVTHLRCPVPGCGATERFGSNARSSF